MLDRILYKGAVSSVSWKALHLTGVDSESFIHNQSTNNVKKLKNYSFQWNTLLDLTGKVVSYFLLLKENQSSIYLLLPAEITDATVARLDKYLIAEDVEIKLVDRSCSIAVGGEAQSISGFSGVLLNDSAMISFDELDSINDDQFNDYWFLQGAPDGNVANIIGKLANNTLLEELAIDYKKGCFLGQETVAKIHTRRGAAFKPVLVELDHTLNAESSDIYVAGKKAGKLLEVREIESKYFAKIEINRENRLDKKELSFTIADKEHLGTIHYFPYFKMTSTEKAQLLYDDAIVAFQNDEEEVAIEKLTQVIKIDPCFEDAYESLGVIYGRHEKFEMAIELMEKLSEINPSSVMAHTNMSLYHMRLGNIEKAEEEKSIATIKTFEKFGKEAQEKKVQEELAKKQQLEQAQRESMFQQVLEIDREDALANYGMGDIELQRQNYSQAIQYLNLAITTDTKYSVAYLALSKAYKESAQYAKAKEILNKGIEVATKNGDMMPANEMQQILQSIKDLN